MTFAFHSIDTLNVKSRTLFLLLYTLNTLTASICVFNVTIESATCWQFPQKLPLDSCKFSLENLHFADDMGMNFAKFECVIRCDGNVITTLQDYIESELFN